MSAASDLLQQVEAFSQRARARITRASSLSPWGSPDYGTSGCQGIVLHYTVSQDLASPVKWFCDPALNAKASAHLIVGRGREAWHDELSRDLPLVAQLPATPVTCRSYTSGAWHCGAPSGNSCYGIELVGAGELRWAGDGWVLGNNNWSEKYRGPEPPVLVGDRHWQPVSLPQVEVSERVGRALRQVWPDIKAARLVGHEHMQSTRTVAEPGIDKRDAGIGFDYHAWRANIMGDGPLRVCAYPRPLGIKAGGVDTSAVQPGQSWALGQLYGLGYAIELGRPADPGNLTSVKMFQTMAGLLADGVVGAKTIAAIAWRVSDRLQTVVPSVS